jgi:hypothetical protein
MANTMEDEAMITEDYSEIAKALEEVNISAKRRPNYLSRAQRQIDNQVSVLTPFWDLDAAATAETINHLIRKE